jgi:hypothetical protein
VGEWCNDWHGLNYIGLPTDDPTGPQAGTNRILRGGSWSLRAVESRSAFRGVSRPDNRDPLIGFRLAMTIDAAKLKPIPPIVANADRAVAVKAFRFRPATIGTTLGLHKSLGELPSKPFRVRHIAVAGELVTDEFLRSLRGLTELDSLLLTNTSVTDNGLRELQRMPKLTELTVDVAAINGSGLKDFRRLQRLSLYRTNVTDSQLRDIAKNESLQYLNLDETSITDAGLKHLSNLKKLEKLILVHTKVTAAGVSELQKALPKCKIVWDDGSVGAWKPTPEQQTFFDAVAQLKREQQISSVNDRLEHVNPAFDNTLQHIVENGCVVELRVVTDKVTVTLRRRLRPSLRREC